jgi:hypothetical protein
MSRCRIEREKAEEVKVRSRERFRPRNQAKRDGLGAAHECEAARGAPGEHAGRLALAFRRLTSTAPSQPTDRLTSFLVAPTYLQRKPSSALNSSRSASSPSSATMPPRAVPRSPSPDTSTDDIPPLAFDTEEELLAVFARLREDLLRRVGAKWEAEGMGGAKGKGKGVDRKKVEDIVLQVSSGRSEGRCKRRGAATRSSVE